MAQNNDNPKPSGGGWGKGLKKFLFSDEFLAQQEDGGNEQVVQNPTTPATPTTPVTPNSVVPAITPIGNVTNDPSLEDKFLALLKTLNHPGCDFFEVWNAAEELGGVTPTNIQSAIKALKFADPSLSKEKILDTGNQYISQLRQAYESDVQKKQQEKNTLENQKNQESKQLSDDIESLDKQIKELQQQRDQKKNSLDTINSKYDPQIVAIATRIQQGGNALEAVVKRMDGVIQIVTQNNY